MNERLEALINLLIKRGIIDDGEIEAFEQELNNYFENRVEDE
jgi:hypothetical protein